MKKLLITTLAALLLALLASTTGAAAQAADPIGIIQAFEAAMNAKDLDAAMSYWADNATLTDTHPAPGQPNPVTGKAAIRANFEFAVKNNARYESANFQVAGDT